MCAPHEGAHGRRTSLQFHNLRTSELQFRPQFKAEVSHIFSGVAHTLAQLLIDRTEVRIPFDRRMSLTDRSDSLIGVEHACDVRGRAYRLVFTTSESAHSVAL